MEGGLGGGGGGGGGGEGRGWLRVWGRGPSGYYPVDRFIYFFFFFLFFSFSDCQAVGRGVCLFNVQ